MTECECAYWCDPDIRVRLLTGHHYSCKHAPLLIDSATDLIRELVRGMESWAADEDGIHPEAWEAYKKGKDLILETHLVRKT